MDPQKSQYDLQKLAAELLTEMPFNRAADIFKKATGEQLTDYTIHQLGTQVGEVACDSEIMPKREHVEKAIQELTNVGDWRWGTFANKTRS